MSDGAIAAVMSGFITVVGMVVGFLTLWVKLRYGVGKAEEAADKAAIVEGKVDLNTEMTAKIEKQTNGPLAAKIAKIEDSVAGKFAQLDDHALRIGSLEVKVEAMKVVLDSLNKNIDSTRHEIRGHLQTITNNLQLLTLAGKVSDVPPPKPLPTRHERGED